MLLPETSNGQNADAVQRGKYLVTITGCNDCHTPKNMGPNGPQPDMAHLLAGHLADAKLPPPPKGSGPWMIVGSGDLTAWSGPWGVSFAANLTPDKATGIGSWPLASFVKALRTGKHMGVGRPILPPMPWEDFAVLTDRDLAAIYAYLQSIPPISNKVPEPILARH
jgi:mono/diheme cytochrome c family protein